MISLQISDTKLFMNKLLLSETFDSFLFEEGFLKLGYTITLDGHINADYYPAEELPDDNFLSWKEIRPILCEHMKGTKTPLSFQFVLHAPTDYTEGLITRMQLAIDPSVVSALVVTMRFDHGKLSIVTGTSFSTFVLDKSLEKAWDQSFKKSLDNLSINYEETL